MDCGPWPNASVKNWTFLDLFVLLRGGGGEVSDPSPPATSLFNFNKHLQHPASYYTFFYEGY